MSESEAAGSPPQIVDALIAALAGMVKHLRADLPDEVLGQQAYRAIQEAEQINAGPIMDAGDVSAYNAWGVRFKGPDGIGTMVLPKPQNVNSAEEKIQTALLLGLLTSPVARTMLRSLGVELEFIQTNIEAKPRILLAR